MTELIRYLKAFNRKERFYLIGAALGNPDFTLSAAFRTQVDAVLGTTIPPDTFVAMDYHLDWVYASLHLDASGGNLGPHSNTDTLIRAQQEDIDLIVAYYEGATCHVILLEAKGDSAWSNKQLASKVGRLRAIFGDGGSTWRTVVPHLLLMSPRPPRLLKTLVWPSWTLPNGSIAWIPMTMGTAPVKVTTCTVDGKVSSQGQYWKVVPGTGANGNSQQITDSWTDS